MKKLNNTTLLRNDGGLRSGIQRNALASLVHFAHNKVNEGCKCIALEAREESTIIPYKRLPRGLLEVTRKPPLKLMIVMEKVFTGDNGKQWAKSNLIRSPQGLFLLVNCSIKTGRLRHPQMLLSVEIF